MVTQTNEEPALEWAALGERYTSIARKYADVVNA